MADLNSLPRDSGENICVEVGQIWRDKRDPHRKVEVTGIFLAVARRNRSYEPVTVDRMVNVKRNTSRRKQAIKVDTLHAKYYRAGVLVDA